MRLLKPVLILSLVPVVCFGQRGGHAGGGVSRGAGGGVRSGSIGTLGGGTLGGRSAGGSIGTPSRGFGIPGAYRGPAVPAGGVYRGSGLLNGGNLLNRGYLGTYGYRGYGYRPIYGYGLGFGLPIYGFGLGFGLPYWGAGVGWPGYYNDTYYPDSYYGPGPGDGGGYGYGSGYDYPPADSGYMPEQPMPEQPMPDFLQNYTPNPPSTGSSSESYYRRPDYFLIAFTDHTIQAALSYRVEGDEIVWTTREQVEKRAPLASVDRSFTEQINRDRRVQFQLQ